MSLTRALRSIGKLSSRRIATSIASSWLMRPPCAAVRCGADTSVTGPNSIGFVAAIEAPGLARTFSAGVVATAGKFGK
jgi:hypothetical protein